MDEHTVTLDLGADVPAIGYLCFPDRIVILVNSTASEQPEQKKAG